MTTPRTGACLSLTLKQITTYVTVCPENRLTSQRIDIVKATLHNVRESRKETAGASSFRCADLRDMHIVRASQSSVTRRSIETVAATVTSWHVYID